MSRKPPSKPNDDVVSYLISRIPGDSWRALKVGAILEQRSIRDVLISLIEEYGEGEPVEKGKRS